MENSKEPHETVNPKPTADPGAEIETVIPSAEHEVNPVEDNSSQKVEKTNDQESNDSETAEDASDHQDESKETSEV